MPTVTKGLGTTLKVSITGTPTLIGQIESITPCNVTTQTVDTSDLDATWKTYVATILDGGELTFVINWNTADTQHAALWTKVTGRANETWLVTYDDSGDSTIGFDGPITSFNVGPSEKENIVKVTLTIKVSGAVTLTP